MQPSCLLHTDRSRALPADGMSPAGFVTATKEVRIETQNWPSVIWL
jgi:hypothetical protein